MIETRAPQGLVRLAAGVGVAAVLLSGCTSGSGSTDAASEASASVEATAPGDASGDPGDESPVLPSQDPVDAAGSLTQFQAPEESTGVPPARAEHCPGANPAHFLAVFPDARPFQAASGQDEFVEGDEDELTLDCQMSYDVDLVEGDLCSVVELRQVVLTATARGFVDTQDGALATTARQTLFNGGAQKPGVTLVYRLTAGCDRETDLSEYEDEFRAVWVANRDEFIATPLYERP